MKGFIEVTTHTYFDAFSTYWNDKCLIKIVDITKLSFIGGLYVLDKKIKTKESYEEIKYLIKQATEL